MADVFISYAHSNVDYAERLADFLYKQNISAFWDPAIRIGEQWNSRLDKELNDAKCVVVLWSTASVDSEWVNKEAQRGSNRQILTPARIDDCVLRREYDEYQLADIQNWRDDNEPIGLVSLLDRITELISEDKKRSDTAPHGEFLILQQKIQNTEHISISDHFSDMTTILRELTGTPIETLDYIRNGYRELQSAQRAAREMLDERAPETHYASAADHFKNALDAIGAKKTRIARDGRSIEYFLSMERANSLAFSESHRGEKYNEALSVYRRLAEFEKYKKDIPIRFRLGCALARGAHTRSDIIQAFEALQDALVLIDENKSESSGGDGQTILTEGQWVYAEISLQMGICQYRLFRLYGMNTIQGQNALNGAIDHTYNALQHHDLLRKANSTTPKNVVDLMSFTIYKALGNLVYYRSLRIRLGRSAEDDAREIKSLIGILSDPKFRHMVENQIGIVSSIAVGAATIGDWDTAEVEARRNHDALTQMATAAPLSADNRAHVARAREILFFAPKMKSMQAKLEEFEVRVKMSD